MMTHRFNSKSDPSKAKTVLIEANVCSANFPAWA